MTRHTEQPIASTSQTLTSTSDFLFQVPELPAMSTAGTLKQQRRVSLPGSPRLAPTWSFRDDTSLSTGMPSCDLVIKNESSGDILSLVDDFQVPSKASKKNSRKKWSVEETNMLVEGCRKHGVGNWKLMVGDPELQFDGRSAVDLKDRFRTYFNDSYRQLYPNAKTHLSNNTARGINADGSSLFDKTRSRRRKPFTPEEDAALKQGYEQHGTSWATIVKDPVFQIQSRRSTDLRDRFRNAFPDLYLSAGYKPRPQMKGSSSVPRKPKPAKRRKGSDGDLPAPTRLRRGRRATTGNLPDTRNALSDGELTSGEDDTPSVIQTPVVVGEMSSPPSTPLDLDLHAATSAPQLHQRHWSLSHTSSPPLAQTTEYFPPTYRTLNMIPKSAWGPQDWLSSNSRMETSGHIPQLSHSTSSGPPSSLSPSRSLSQSFSQAVFDRYDLSSAGHLSPNYDFAQSEAAGGYGGADSAFSDVDMYASSSFRGFTHHSNTAGDLIFGMRTQGGGLGYPAFDLGTGTVNPMQLHAIDEQFESARLPDGQLQAGVPASLSTSQHSSADVVQNTVSMAELNIQEPANTLPTDPHDFPPKLAPIPDTNVADDHEVIRTPTIPLRPITDPLQGSTFPSLVRYPGTMHRSMSAQPQFPSHHDSGLPPSQDPNFLTDTFSLMPPGLGQHSVIGDDIPFLDLHYWGSSSGTPSADMFGQQALLSHSTGALDLAQSPVQRVHNRSPPLPKPPASRIAKSHSTPIPLLSTFEAEGSSRPMNQHHRVQSAMSLLDLQLTRSENKRKRASWDGGV